MKKVFRIFALILIMTGMLTISAVAAPSVQDIETKDAPEIIAAPNEEGKEANAVIRDEDSTVLGSISAKELEVTTIAEAKDDETHQRLMDAWEQLRKESLEDIVPDIAKALGEKSTSVSVEDLVIYNVIDLSSNAEDAKLLEKEGNNVTITFKTDLKKDQLFFVIQNYEENKWRIIPDEMLVHDKDDENVLSVTVDSLTPIAFVGFVDDVNDTNNAEVFVPSVKQKGAPNVVAPEGEEDRVAAVIYNSSDEAVAKIMEDELSITPIYDVKDAQDPVSVSLNNAYNQIMESGSLKELVPEIEEHLSATAQNVAATDFVVRDLFDITITGENASYLEQEGNDITFTFEMGLKDNEALVVLHNYEADKWEIIPEDMIVRYPNGNVSVTFNSLSPIALAVAEVPVAETPEVQEEVPVVADAVNEEAEAPVEESGHTGIIVACSVAGVVVVVAIIAAVVASKKKSKNTVTK